MPGQEKDRITSAWKEAIAKSGEALLRHAIVEVPCDSPDWVDSGLEVRAGETVTLLSAGALGVAGAPEASFPADLFLWRRIGARGATPIFRRRRRHSRRRSRGGSFSSRIIPAHGSTRRAASRRTVRATPASARSPSRSSSGRSRRPTRSPCSPRKTRADLRPARALPRTSQAAARLGRALAHRRDGNIPRALRCDGRSDHRLPLRRQCGHHQISGRHSARRDDAPVLALARDRAALKGRRGLRADA